MEPLPTPPAELKALTPWITRGNELLKADPIMAYWCTFYAAQQGISSKPQGKESKELLMQVLDSLEARKAALGQEPAVTDDAAGKAYVENFALKVFVGADNEDRAGKATRATAKKFIAAGNFLDLLKLFEDLPQGIEEKIKYAKWKAGDIAKAFREGRQPVPGPPGGLGDNPEVEPEAAAAAAALLGGSSKEEDDYVAREMAKLMDNTSVPQDTNGVATGQVEQADAGVPRAITPPSVAIDAASAAAGVDERPGHARSPSFARRKAQLSLSSSPATAGSPNFSMPLRHPVSRDTSTENIFDAPYSAPCQAQQPTSNGLPSINTPPATAGDFSSGQFARPRPASVIGVEGFFPGGVGLGGNTGGGNRPLPTPPPRDGLPIPPGPPNANIPPNQRPPSASMFLQHHNRSNQGSPNMQGSLPLPPSGLPPPSLGSPYTLPQFVSSSASSRSTSQHAIQTQPPPAHAHAPQQQPLPQPSAPALPPAPSAPFLPANVAPAAPSQRIEPFAPPTASAPPPLAPSAPALPPAVNAAAARALAPAPAPVAAPVVAPPPPAAAAAAALPESLPANLSARVQKLTKFAASALDYDDLETARRQLREALDICEGRITK